jgi:hypothetical protein
VLKTELERKFKNKKQRRQNFQELLVMYNTQKGIIFVVDKLPKMLAAILKNI